MPISKQDHLDAARGPKRILSLDGGGLRGMLSLQYLKAIESMLAARGGRGDAFRLCDYFDLIGGTSTGAIIAAALACGMSVAEVEALYSALGTSVFKRSLLRQGLLAAKFPSERVQAALDEHLGGDLTLDDARLRTGLMVMTKRLDTGSPWPLHNHPGARYSLQDGKLLLTHIVRASTAAPTYFEPERLTIASRDGRQTEAAFVDGGVSPYNDPSLQLLMLACLEGHGFRWRPGADQLLLVSVGTGTYRGVLDTAKIMRMPAAEQGLRSLQSLMDDCARTNQALLQWMTRSLTPWAIDRAVGDMAADSAAGPGLATSVRYNVLLEPDWLQRELGLAHTAAELEDLAAMDEPAQLGALAALGAAAAQRQVQVHHFPAAFDLS